MEAAWRRSKKIKKVISRLRCSFAGLGSERGLEPSAAAGDAEKEPELKLGQIKMWREREKKKKKVIKKKHFYSRVLICQLERL